MDSDDRARTGLERFYDKYPNHPKPVREEQYEHLGVGAPMVDPTQIVKYIK